MLRFFKTSILTLTRGTEESDCVFKTHFWIIFSWHWFATGQTIVHRDLDYFFLKSSPQVHSVCPDWIHLNGTFFPQNCMNGILPFMHVVVLFFFTNHFKHQNTRCVRILGKNDIFTKKLLTDDPQIAKKRVGSRRCGTMGHTGEPPAVRRTGASKLSSCEHSFRLKENGAFPTPWGQCILRNVLKRLAPKM